MERAFKLIDIGMEIIRLEIERDRYPKHSRYRARFEKQIRIARTAELMLITNWNERKAA